MKRNFATSAPNVPAAVISALKQSVAALLELDPSVRILVLPAYLHSIAQSFLLGVPAAALASLCAMYVAFLLTGIDFDYHSRTVRNLSLAESQENISHQLEELSVGSPVAD